MNLIILFPSLIIHILFLDLIISNTLIELISSNLFNFHQTLSDYPVLPSLKA